MVVFARQCGAILMDTGAYESNFSISTLDPARQVRHDCNRRSRSGIPNPASVIIGIWTRWSEERRIMRAVEALTMLDDGTLRDLGIPDRSEIEFTVRFCLEC
jgi:uncharacterized protein YjiS (DUF1127 family)